MSLPQVRERKMGYQRREWWRDFKNLAFEIIGAGLYFFNNGGTK
jgi:hypothetical protein